MRQLTLIDQFKFFKDLIGWRLHVIVLLTFLAAVSEGLGIVMVLPLLSELQFSGLTQAAPLSGIAGANLPDTREGVGVAEDAEGFITAALSGLELSPWALLLLIALGFVVKGVFLFGAHSYSTLVRARVLDKIRRALLEQHELASYDFVSGYGPGELANQLGDQTQRVIMALYFLLLTLGQMVTAAALICFAVLVSPLFGFLSAAVGLAIFLIFGRVNVLVRESSINLASANSQLYEDAVECFATTKYLKAVGATQRIYEKIAVSMEVVRQNFVRFGIAAALTQSAREPFTLCALLLIVGLQVKVLGGSVAPIIASILLLYRATNALYGVQAYTQNNLEYSGSLAELRSFMALQRANCEPTGTTQHSNNVQIEFNNVSFKYPGSTSYTLENVSLLVGPGELAVFVGPSGGGKSTLFDLLSGLRMPTSGTVFIDGIPTTELDLEKWRNSIGFLSQEIALFSGSVRQNILLNFKRSALMNDDCETQIMEALRQAALLDQVSAMPAGIEAEVQASGKNLSGGQRQRLGIARELYKKSQLYLFDEPTSALDSTTELVVEKSILRLVGTSTVLMASHRPGLIENADRIYSVEKGRVEEIKKDHSGTGSLFQ